MADATKIEWADSTFNPWMGCTQISPACDHCYAKRDTARFGRVAWGPGAPRAGKIYGSGPDWQTIDPGCTRWEEVVRIGEHGRNTRQIENCTSDMGEEVFMQRVGKKLAGHMLDGRVHSQFPTP